MMNDQSDCLADDRRGHDSWGASNGDTGYGTGEIHASRVREEIHRFAGRELEKRRTVLLEAIRGQVPSQHQASLEGPDRSGYRAASVQTDPEARIGIALPPYNQSDSPVTG